ncbi:MAG: ABC transporter permease, partial [Actinomycetota bacterium]|nr:ABC transporter permease [Actinomycetota bacterium]
MLRAAWRNLLARKTRLLLSTFAIVLGVGFVAGTSVFTDTLGKSFDAIVDASVGDVVVRPTVKGEAQFGGFDARTLPGPLVDQLAAVPGVARADGNLTVEGVFVVDGDGQVVGGQGPPGIGVNLNDAPNAAGETPGALTAGRAPEGPDEIALDGGTAERAGYDVGDTVPLVTAGTRSRLEATLVGIYTFSAGLNGATLTLFDTDAMQELFFDGEDVYTDIWVSGSDEESQDELRDAVAADLPDDVEALTGDAAAEEQKDAIGQVLQFIN